MVKVGPGGGLNFWVGAVVLYKERKKTKGKMKDEGVEKIEEEGEENGSIMK